MPQLASSTKETCLQEAQRLVYGDRQGDYGHPWDDFSKTAKFWSTILGVDVTPEQVGLCMVAVKISRHINHPKRDNLVDMAGYAETVHRVMTKREELEKPIIAGGSGGTSSGATGSRPWSPSDKKMDPTCGDKGCSMCYPLGLPVKYS